jgi:hypothetical protein
MSPNLAVGCVNENTTNIPQIIVIPLKYNPSLLYYSMSLRTETSVTVLGDGYNQAGSSFSHSTSNLHHVCKIQDR